MTPGHFDNIPPPILGHHGIDGVLQGGHHEQQLRPAGPAGRIQGVGLPPPVQGDGDGPALSEVHFIDQLAIGQLLQQHRIIGPGEGYHGRQQGQLRPAHDDDVVCRHIPARQGQPRGAGPTMHFGSDFGVVAQQRIGIRQIGQGPQAVGQGGDVGYRVDGDRVILQGSCAFYMEGQIEVPD